VEEEEQDGERHRINDEECASLLAITDEPLPETWEESSGNGRDERVRAP
jgi:hypothetical protein